MKMIKPIISIIVCVILTLCVLVPVTNSMINDTLVEKYYNEVGSPAFVYSPDDDPNINITYDLATHTITGTDVGNSSRFFMMSDNFLIRVNLDSVRFIFAYVDENGENYATHVNYTSASTITSANVIINPTNITVNLIGESTTTYTFNYTFVSLTNPNGDYRFIQLGDSPETVYVNNANDIDMITYVEDGGNFVSVINGLATFDGVSSTLKYDPTAVNNVENVSTVVIGGDNPTFGVEHNDTVYSSYYFLFPSVVEGSTHGNSTVIMMLSILPMLVVVSLIVGTVLLIRFNRT